MERGFWKLGALRGVAVELHWTALLLALVIGGFRWDPAGWVAYLLLILLHEVGHALVARKLKLRVFALRVHGMGGECVHAAAKSPIGTALIAWGGVWAQFAVLALSCALLFALPAAIGRDPLPVWLSSALQNIGVRLNLFMIAFNLIPYGRLDGVRAWPLFRLLYLRWKQGRIAGKLSNLRAASAPSLRGSDGAAPASKGRSGKPSLRLVYGGLADELGLKSEDAQDQAQPPKDKNLLN